MTESTNNPTNVEEINTFINLLNKRQEIYDTLTEDIFKIISNNILEGFKEILQLPSENIIWLDLYHHHDEEDNEDILILSFQLNYTKDQMNSFIRENFGGDLCEDENIRIVKFGLPLFYVFASKEEIKQFVMSITDSDLSNIDNTLLPTQPNFDTSNLTQQQINQINWFKNKKGTVQ